MVRNAAPELSRRDLYRALFRHKRKGLGFFFCVLFLVGLATSFSTRSYRSEGKLLVRLGRENATLDPTATLGREPVISFGASREHELNSVVEILVSQTILEQVAQAVGPELLLHRDRAGEPGSTTSNQAAIVNWKQWLSGGKKTERVSDLELAARQLRQSLEVFPIRDSNLVYIAYEADDPRLAQRVVDELIDHYLEYHVRLHRTEGSREFLEAQTARLRNALAETEDDLRKLKDESGLASPEAQREIAVKQIGALEDELALAIVAKAASEARVEQLQQKLAELPKTEMLSRTSGHPNEAADRMRQRLFDLEIELEQYRARYTDDHPLMLELREQVGAAQAILKKEVTSRDQITAGKSKVFGEAEAALLEEQSRLAELKAKIAGTKTQLLAAREQLKKLNANLVRISKLERDLALQEENYRKYSVNLEQSRIDEALELQRISNISVAQPATRSHEPVRPKIALNVLLGLMVGTVGGLALTLTSQYLDHSFETPEQVENELGIPALVSVPELTRRQLKLG